MVAVKRIKKLIERLNPGIPDYPGYIAVGRFSKEFNASHKTYKTNKTNKTQRTPRCTDFIPDRLWSYGKFKTLTILLSLARCIYIGVATSTNVIVGREYLVNLSLQGCLR